jgi:hypothetical protein
LPTLDPAEITGSKVSNLEFEFSAHAFLKRNLISSGRKIQYLRSNRYEATTSVQNGTTNNHHSCMIADHTKNGGNAIAGQSFIIESMMGNNEQLTPQ